MNDSINITIYSDGEYCKMTTAKDRKKTIKKWQQGNGREIKAVFTCQTKEKDLFPTAKKAFLHLGVLGGWMRLSKEELNELKGFLEANSDTSLSFTQPSLF